MKRLLFSLLLCSHFALAQIYSNNHHLNKKNVSGQWLDGTLVLNDGSALEGQVRGFTYKANDVQSFRFRKKKAPKPLPIKPMTLSKSFMMA